MQSSWGLCFKVCTYMRIQRFFKCTHLPHVHSRSLTLYIISALALYNVHCPWIAIGRYAPITEAPGGEGVGTPSGLTITKAGPGSAPGGDSPHVARARGRHSLPQVAPPPGALTTATII